MECANCGEPVAARGPAPKGGHRWCNKPECQRTAGRVRDAARRASRLGYNRDFRRAQRAPSRSPRPQKRGDLPPLGVLIADDDGERIQCHVCGEFFAGLNHHIRGAHRMTLAYYRETYGLARGLSLSSPGTQARLRAAAIARKQGERYRGELAPHPREPGTVNRLSSRIQSSRNAARRQA